MCGDEFVLIFPIDDEFSCCTNEWNKVTCKRCLRHKPKERKHNVDSGSHSNRATLPNSGNE